MLKELAQRDGFTDVIPEGDIEVLPFLAERPHLLDALNDVGSLSLRHFTENELVTSLTLCG